MSALPTLGASEAAAVLGLNPWQRPIGVWARMTGLVARYAEEDTPAQARGRMFEEPLALRFAAGRPIERGPVIGEQPWVAGELPWLHARPDFIVADKELAECKTARRLDDEHGWGIEGTAQVPPQYAVQVLVQLAVAARVRPGLKRCVVVAFGVLDDDYREYPIVRDVRREERLLAGLHAWYERHIVRGEMPALDGSDAASEALRARYRGRAEREWLDAGDDDFELVMQMRAATKRRDDAARERAELQQRLQNRIGDAYGLRHRGRDLCSWAPVKGRTSVDLVALRRDHPDLIAKYTTTSQPSRRFRALGEESE